VQQLGFTEKIPIPRARKKVRLQARCEEMQMARQGAKSRDVTQSLTLRELAEIEKKIRKA